MTDEQIIQIAENHFCCNVSVMEYSARQKDIIEFARAIRAQSVADGYDLAVMDRIREEQSD